MLKGCKAEVEENITLLLYEIISEESSSNCYLCKYHNTDECKRKFPPGVMVKVLFCYISPQIKSTSQLMG